MFECKLKDEISNILENNHIEYKDSNKKRYQKTLEE